MSITERAAKVLREIDDAIAVCNASNEVMPLVAAEYQAQNSWQDSYGVPDSEWDVCDICEAADQPGVFAAGIPHEKTCKVAIAKCFINASRTGYPLALHCLKMAIEAALESIEFCFRMALSEMAQRHADRLATLCEKWEACSK